MIYHSSVLLIVEILFFRAPLFSNRIYAPWYFYYGIVWSKSRVLSFLAR